MSYRSTDRTVGVASRNYPCAAAFGVAFALACCTLSLDAAAQGAGLNTLYRFTGGADGAILFRGPTFDAAGNLYGDAIYGANACPDTEGSAGVGCGTIWKLDTSNTFTTLVTFSGSDNGADPDGNLTIRAKKIFGTANAGGAANLGTVFQVGTDGSGFQTLYTFSGLDGARPQTKLRLDAAGDMFSATYSGGPAFNGTAGSGFGVLFEIPKAGGYVALHNFTGGADGGGPARIFLDKAGTIFGAAETGGACAGTGLPAAGCGTIYSYTPSTGAFQTLYTFTGGADGYKPTLAGVAGIAEAGSLFGSTNLGGALGYGTLFELRPNSSGGYDYVHLYDFTGGADGAYPSVAKLRPSGELVGGTNLGPITQSGSGAGVLFDFKQGQLTTLYTFLNDANGGYPYGTPIVSKSGLIYGTTGYGGVSPCNTSGGVLISTFGCGTIYLYNPFGASAKARAADADDSLEDR